MRLPESPVLDIDFTRIIREILAGGVSKAALARTLNVPFSTLTSWQAGCAPRWHDGEKLLIEHKKVTNSGNP